MQDETPPQLIGQTRVPVSAKPGRPTWQDYEYERKSAEVAAWQAHRDQLNAKIDWQFNTDKARIKLERLYPTLQV